jgi:very-short-patch-repair endonuclease
VLEVDGIHHRESLSATEYDAERDHILHKHGVRTIMRVTAARCHEEPQSVVREFLALLAAPAANAAPTPPLPNVRASSVDKPAS